MPNHREGTEQSRRALRQIALGLDGAHPQIMLKARLAIRELLGQIRLEPQYL
jgi:hypothetical protein